MLSVEEEAVIVAFRRYMPLPLDDCLYALQSTILTPFDIVAGTVGGDGRAARPSDASHARELHLRP